MYYYFVMKIIVVSDSHGNTSLLREIKEKYYDADLFIHCGDYELPEYLMNGFMHVKGNCDYDNDAPSRIDIPTKWGNIHVEHGNSYQFMCNKKEYIKNLNAFIFLFGHTHEKLEAKVGNTYLFNPGSLTYPRDSNTGSFLVINIDEKTNEIKWKFIDVE